MSKKNTTQLLKQLRALMKNNLYVPKTVQAYVVPSGDAHQSEYICPCDQRRAFISGFTGSAGIAIITESAAALWTDGRYFIQASQEIDENWTLMKQGLPSTPTYAKWLSQILPLESSVGVDPFLYNGDEWADLSRDLHTNGHTLVPVHMNLVDLAWGAEQPERPHNIVFPLELRYTGLNLSEKVEKVREKLKEENANCLVITALDEIAYLYNLRGTDIDYNPVFFSYAVVTLSGTFLFIDESKLTTEAVKELAAGDCIIDVQPYENLSKFIENQLSNDNGKIWIPNKSSYAISSLAPNERKVTKISPIALMKAIKNETEIQGMDSCHIRDAAALCRYFNWLEKQAPMNKQTEISGADYLEKLRGQQDNFVGLSFTTISSVGPNAAIIHYSPSVETDRLITSNEIYLVDSGGQYKDGTTDVTRTMHFGTPSDFEKECFTRVLKGCIALAACIFPDKTKGHYLDTLARKSLWDVGLNYKHGTGHGIGMYLNVHEGPMGISHRVYPDDPGMHEGMYLSDEPGYYEDGKFGIRIENIVRIVKAETEYKRGETGFLTFKTITLVPIQTKMIDQSLLTEKEINWLNDYHSECRSKVGPLLLQQGNKDDYDWLINSTQPLG